MIITLIFSLFGYAVIPYGPGLAISDSNLGILYMLAVSSLSTYGILLAGWTIRILIRLCLFIS
jgi:NADH-ubiquinone oxidoreductase chain 1